MRIKLGMLGMLGLAGGIGCVPTRAQVAVQEPAAQPLPSGRGSFLFPGAALQVFTYKPAAYKDGPLLVVFHGVGRDAGSYRDHAIPMAERFQAIVVAPLFDAPRFGRERYQRGGLFRDGRLQPADQWTFAQVAPLVAYVRMREGRPGLPAYLIGHSGGGQFLERMAAFLPGESCRIVAANPGTHLFPTRDLPFPYGFGGLPRNLGDDAALRAYLAAPLTLYLGTGDTVQDKDFATSPRAMEQGSTRLERGRACFEMARRLAAEKRWPFNWRKVEVQGVGHSAGKMFAQPEVADALFGAAPARLPPPSP